MTMFPLVQAVESPEPDAAVLFDFNDEGAWSTGATSGALAEGWTLGVPQRLSAAGDPRTAWGPRRCEFAIRIKGDRHAAQAAQSRLARWLMRPDGWLRFQLDALSRPVWLRILGSDPGALSFDQVYVRRTTGDMWELGCGFDADPFVYGERVTVPATELSADAPWFELPAVAGDAPARLRVTVQPSGGVLGASSLALHSAPYPGTGIITWQAEGFTDGTGSSSEANADASGGSWKRIDFASPAMGTRFSGTAPVAVPSGLYRVWVRGRNTAASATVPTQLTVGSVSSSVVSWAPSAGSRWMSYGLMQVPAGVGVLPGVTGGSVSPSVVFAAGAAGLTSADDLLVDKIVLLPVRRTNDYRESAALDVSASSGAWNTLLVDGDYETHYGTLDGVLSDVQSLVNVTGGWLEAHPGTVNTVAAWRADTAPLTGSMGVTVSYHPRYVYLAGEVA